MNSILKKITFLITIFFLSGFLSLLIPVDLIYGQDICNTCKSGGSNWNSAINCGGCDAAQKLACETPCTTYSGKLENPLGNENLGPDELYGRLIYAFMGITGALALIMFLIGGFQWMTASGNPERVKKGRDTLMWAVLGLIVIFSSYAILRAVFETLQFS